MSLNGYNSSLLSIVPAGPQCACPSVRCLTLSNDSVNEQPGLRFTDRLAPLFYSTNNRENLRVAASTKGRVGSAEGEKKNRDARRGEDFTCTRTLRDISTYGNVRR